MLDPGAIIALDVEKPAAGGRMLGRCRGQVVLVWGAIPGERIEARVERAAKGVVYADTAAVLTPSPDRRPLEADWRCGGSVLAHVAYPRQLEIKGQIVDDAFRRIGRVPLPAPPAVESSPETGYRMRARLHAHDARIGFYREGTHQICDAAATRQLRPETNEWIVRAASVLREHRLSGLAGVEIAENISGDQRACHLELHAGAAAEPFAVLGEGLRGLSAQAADARQVHRLAGDPSVADDLRPGAADRPVLHLRRDVRSFFQGNRFLLERLVRHVASFVPNGPIVDLYAGVGLFGLSLASMGIGPVTLVEGDPISGSDLATNAKPFGDAVAVERRSVESYLGGSMRNGHEVTVVVDPPRTGMTRDALAKVIDASPPRIVYVSCDVATLARDTRSLVDSGYALGPLRAFDLFPNTAHVETVAVFTR
jgi:23S rRNA (uracil1939-C5)-methyltransferase